MRPAGGSFLKPTPKEIKLVAIVLMKDSPNLRDKLSVEKNKERKQLLLKRRKSSRNKIANIKLSKIKHSITYKKLNRSGALFFLSNNRLLVSR